MILKKINPLLPCLFFFLMLFPETVRAKEPWVIFTYDSPPFSFQTPKNIRKGLSIDIGVLMLKNAGYCVAAIKPMPWKRALRELEQTPNAMLHNVARLPLREKKYQWIGPYYSVRVMLFKLARRDDIQFSELKEARWYKVAAERGSGFISHDIKPKGVDVIEADTNLHVLKLLEAGKVDLAALPEHGIKQLSNTLGIPAGHFKPVATVVSRDIYFAVAPNTPLTIMEKLHQSLETIKKDGRLAKIAINY